MNVKTRFHLTKTKTKTFLTKRRNIIKYNPRVETQREKESERGREKLSEIKSGRKKSTMKKKKVAHNIISVYKYRIEYC